MKNKLKITLGLRNNELVPVHQTDLKRIIQEFSENWGQVGEVIDGQPLRFFPVSFLPVLIEIFDVLIIK